MITPVLLLLLLLPVLPVLPVLLSAEQEPRQSALGVLEVWPESHWPGFTLREADVFKSYMAW